MLILSQVIDSTGLTSVELVLISSFRGSDVRPRCGVYEEQPPHQPLTNSGVAGEAGNYKAASQHGASMLASSKYHDMSRNAAWRLKVKP